jgi:LuxR family maltose regulon positive regulatory protein
MKNQIITEQELIILRLLQRGLTNEMISNKAGISINTVKFHLKNIYRKLGVNNRVSALNKFNESLIK